MKKGLILKFRNIYKELFYFIRKQNMKRFVFKKKRSQTTKQVLTKDQIRECKAFYAKYQRISPIFHNYYTEHFDQFCVNFIPDDIYYNRINLFYSDPQDAKVMDNKCNYHKLFPDIPQPELITYKCNHIWFIDGKIVSYDQAVEALMQAGEVFAKQATDCGGGSGVMYIKVSDEDSVETVQQKLNKLRGDIVVQKALKQHKDIAVINPSSVNTIRILSLLSVDGVKIYSSLLRIGVGDTKVDNIATGGLIIGIQDDGKLKKEAHFLTGERFTEHPVSKVVFADYQLPSFEQAKELVYKAHLNVPHFRMVSWDISIDEAGTPIMIEANLSDGQIDLHQLLNGPLFGEDTEKILDEVFGFSE